MGIVKGSAKFARKVLPEGFLDKTEWRLESTNVALSAEEFLGISLTIAILAGVGGFLAGFILFSVIFGILASIGGLIITFVVISRVVPYYLAQRRAKELEEDLPDALRQMASTFRAGVGMNAAMEDVSKSGYGSLSQEFNRAVVEIRRGRALEDSLAAIAKRSNSELYERAFRLIVEGIERGAALADVLDAVSKDAREVHTIQRERHAGTMQQVLFLIAASLFAAPFIVGLVVAISGAFSTLGVAGAAGVTRVLPSGMKLIVLLFILIQAAICSLAVGVIRYGRMMKGIMFTAPFVIGAGAVFYGAQIVGGLVF